MPPPSLNDTPSQLARSPLKPSKAPSGWSTIQHDPVLVMNLAAARVSTELARVTTAKTRPER